jgi:hypothetical protein
MHSDESQTAIERGYAKRQRADESLATASRTKQRRTSEDMMDDFETIRIETADGIAWLYFHRPDKRNAMSLKLNDEMLVALDCQRAD